MCIRDRFPADQAQQSIVATSAILTSAQEQGLAPAGIIETVRSGAYEAFLSASHTTMILSAVMVVIAALLVGFLLPSIRPPRQGDESPADTWDRDGEATLEEVAHEQGLPDRGADRDAAAASGATLPPTIGDR